MGTGRPVPSPRMAFRAGFVASLSTAYAPDATGVAVSGPRELLAGLAATSCVGSGSAPAESGHGRRHCCFPWLGAALGSASPHLGPGHLVFLVCGPGDWLHVLSLTDLLLPLLKTAANSPAPPVRCWHAWDKAWDVSRAAGTGLGWWSGCRRGQGMGWNSLYKPWPCPAAAWHGTRPWGC